MSDGDDLEEEPELTKQETAQLFGEIAELRVADLERLERKPPGKNTHLRIAKLREIIRNCYAAYYYLSKP